MQKAKLKTFVKFACSLAILMLTMIGGQAVNAAETQTPVNPNSPLLNEQTSLKDVGRIGYNQNEAPRDIRTIVASIIEVVLGLLGMIFLIIIIIGGFRYMTALGNDKATGEALGYIKNGVIGLLIILVSFAIVIFVVRGLNFATSGNVNTFSNKTY